MDLFPIVAITSAYCSNSQTPVSSNNHNTYSPATDELLACMPGPSPKTLEIMTCNIEKYPKDNQYLRPSNNTMA
ncbi:hypothetical protein JMN32_22170 [Fulvivirga sp. 29W222]|uniref:Uncharacterized protein n=1 Tax=Fulvivirga marina TaxID=2494733 RepID=A0A937FZH5_9BACT|nr:hypothetical protein [Fulvivirga marina]